MPFAKISKTPEELKKITAEYLANEARQKLLAKTKAKPQSDTGWVKFGKKRFLEAWKDLEPSELLIMTHLALYEDYKHRAWPSIRRIARETKLAKSTVQISLKNLEKKGAILKAKSDGRHSVYELLK